MFAFVAKVNERGSWVQRIEWRDEEGLGELYRTIGCKLVEIAGTGELRGIPVILWVDEEGLYHEPVMMNLAACDLLAEATSSAPAYLLGGGLVGQAVLLFTKGSDHRGFTIEEADKIGALLLHGGYSLTGRPAVA